MTIVSAWRYNARGGHGALLLFRRAIPLGTVEQRVLGQGFRQGSTSVIAVKVELGVSERLINRRRHPSEYLRQVWTNG